MKRALLATTMLIWASAAYAQTQQNLTPGQGAATDCQGHVWTINADAKILVDGIPVQGGGDTEALLLQGCTIYGKDNGAYGGGWFTMNSANPTSVDGWTASAAPSGATTVAAIPKSRSAPAIPTVSPHVCARDVPSGAFHVVGGQIIGPDGQPFIARGINLGPDKMNEAVSNGDAMPLRATFPGINMVRFADGSRSSPDALRSFITTLTAKGIVVEIEDHPWPLVNAYAGGELQAEAAWFAGLGAAFKDNPYVWFGTQNEPQGGDISAEHVAVYKAVRGAGNNNPIMLDLMGGGVPNALTNGLNMAAYASMTNVVWDFHTYNWILNYSTDQAALEAKIKDTTAQVQQITSADGKVPVIIGEYGDFTDGQKVDPGGKETVAAVINIGSTGVHGSLAWNWSAGGGGGDHLINGDHSASIPYGQMVQMFIGTDVIPCTATETAANARSDLTQITTQAATASSSATPPSASPPPSVDAAIQAQIDAADAAIAQADAIMATAKSGHP